MKSGILAGLPANLVIKTHDAVRIGGQVHACRGLGFSRHYEGKAWKKYQNAVNDRIGEADKFAMSYKNCHLDFSAETNQAALSNVKHRID